MDTVRIERAKRSHPYSQARQDQFQLDYNAGQIMNPKRQRFCEEYAVDLNGAQAAIRAGYAPGSAKVTASRLLTDDNVRTRVDQLIAEGRERLNIDLDSLTEMLVDDRKLAHDNKQAGAAVSATEKIAKIHRLPHTYFDCRDGLISNGFPGPVSGGFSARGGLHGAAGVARHEARLSRNARAHARWPGAPA